MSRVFSYAVKGFGDQFSKDRQAELERKDRAAELAKERIYKAEQRSKELEQEYRLRKEAKRDELKTQYEMMDQFFGGGSGKDTALGQQLSVYDGLPEDIKKQHIQAHLWNIMNGDIEKNATLASTAVTLKDKLRSQEKDITSSKIAPKWPGEFDPEKYIEEQGAQLGRVYTIPSDVKLTDPEFKQTQQRARDIFNVVAKTKAATDSQGNPLGIVDVDSPADLAEATNNLLAGINFSKDFVNKKYETDPAFRKRKDKDLSKAREVLTSAYETFNKYGIDITSAEFDDIMTPQEQAIIDTTFKNYLDKESTTPASAKVSEKEAMPATESMVPSAFVHGKEYKPGDTLNGIVLTEEMIRQYNEQQQIQ